MSFKIIGTGMYVPSRAVTNDDLAQIVETNDEWITKRVGIKERRISETEFTSEMGAKAAQAALDNAGYTAADVDPILAIMTVTAVETKRLTQRSRKDKQEMRDEMRARNKKYKD